jgi:hypothetical protein
MRKLKIPSPRIKVFVHPQNAKDGPEIAALQNLSRQHRHGRGLFSRQNKLFKLALSKHRKL